MSGLKFASQLREIRIHLCQTGKQSAGARKFIQTHYVPIKRANPSFPILIRECSGVQPRVWVRFDKGVEKSMKLTDLDSNKVLEAVKSLVT